MRGCEGEGVIGCKRGRETVKTTHVAASSRERKRELESTVEKERGRESCKVIYQASPVCSWLLLTMSVPDWLTD